MKFSIFAQAHSGDGESYGWRRVGQELGRADALPTLEEYNEYYRMGAVWAATLKGYHYDGVDTHILEEDEQPYRWIEPIKEQ